MANKDTSEGHTLGSVHASAEDIAKYGSPEPSAAERKAAEKGIDVSGLPPEVQKMIDEIGDKLSPTQRMDLATRAAQGRIAAEEKEKGKRTDLVVTALQKVDLNLITDAGTRKGIAQLREALKDSPTQARNFISEFVNNEQYSEGVDKLPRDGGAFNKIKLVGEDGKTITPKFLELLTDISAEARDRKLTPASNTVKDTFAMLRQASSAFGNPAGITKLLGHYDRVGLIAGLVGMATGRAIDVDTQIGRFLDKNTRGDVTKLVENGLDVGKDNFLDAVGKLSPGLSSALERAEGVVRTLGNSILPDKMKDGLSNFMQGQPGGKPLAGAVPSR